MMVCCRYKGVVTTPFQHCVPGTQITVAFYSDDVGLFTGYQAVYYINGKKKTSSYVVLQSDFVPLFYGLNMTIQYETVY